MMEKLQVDKKRIPSQFEKKLSTWLLKLTLIVLVFKQHFITNKLDGSEDYQVNYKLFDLIVNEMKDFRKTLMVQFHRYNSGCNQVNSTKRNKTKKHWRERITRVFCWRMSHCGYRIRRFFKRRERNWCWLGRTFRS